MDFLFRYLKQYVKTAIVFFIFAMIFAIIFAAYHFPLEAIFYPTLICTVVGIIIIILNYKKTYKKYKDLMKINKLDAELIDELPKIESVYEDSYQKIIRKLCKEKEEILTSSNVKYTEMLEYYTIWAHQIKTPIASMRLNIQNDDSELSYVVKEDLVRIEQYVEMVLAFLRLDSESSDYVIKECNIDNIIKSSVKKFTSQFIRKKIKLEYSELGLTVVTDEKWLEFIIEQILSNALKYTKKGSIKIYSENNTTLCISDTGIGIAAEDLPRIFEKGYTGYNGRTDKRASGIGLYLCNRILNKLGHKINVSSTLGVGTIVKINFDQIKREYE